MPWEVRNFEEILYLSCPEYEEKRYLEKKFFLKYVLHQNTKAKFCFENS